MNEEVTARLACQVQGDAHFYDLRSLMAEENYFLNVSQSQSLNFNFCKQLSKENVGETGEDEWCLTDKTATFAYLKDTNAKECYPLTTSSLYPTTINLANTYKPKHLKLRYQSQTMCHANPLDTYSITFQFECAANQETDNTSSSGERTKLTETMQLR